MAVATGGLLVLALLVGATPLLITHELSRTSHALNGTLEQLGATEEVEVSLLLHDRERQLLEATGAPEHAQRAQRALEELRSWLARLPVEGTTAQRTAALGTLHRAVEDYLAHAGE